MAEHHPDLALADLATSEEHAAASLLSVTAQWSDPTFSAHFDDGTAWVPVTAALPEAGFFAHGVVRACADNPQYELRVAAACSLTLSLRRPARHWDRHNKRLSAHTRTSSREMEAMISFYVIEGTAGGSARLHAPSRRKVTVRHMAPFVPLHENSVTLKLSPLPNDAPYIIMPCTFGAGQRGPFSLGATADGDFELLPLPDVVPPNT